MSWPTAIVLSVMLMSLAYCGKGGITIDCHDWTAQECIEFVESVKGLKK